ncbi:hypothetical protein C8R47DRAFT_976965 [Mycena vitilis]|nr:hypothetical protein C8R47DRAFT_976965 [Mycena vitilis]
MFELSLPRALVLFLLVLPTPTLQRSTLGERALPPLSAAAISTLVSSPDPLRQLDPTDPSSHLSHILIPRVPDTENNTHVRNYIVSKLEALNLWSADWSRLKKRFDQCVIGHCPSALGIRRHIV